MPTFNFLKWTIWLASFCCKLIDVKLRKKKIFGFAMRSCNVYEIIFDICIRGTSLQVTDVKQHSHSLKQFYLTHKTQFSFYARQDTRISHCFLHSSSSEGAIINDTLQHLHKNVCDKTRMERKLLSNKIKQNQFIVCN